MYCYLENRHRRFHRASEGWQIRRSDHLRAAQSWACRCGRAVLAHWTATRSRN